MKNQADSVEEQIEFKYTLHCIKVGRRLPNATKEILRVQTDANHAESGSNARRPFGDGDRRFRNLVKSCLRCLEIELL